jgi:hypothetical protein
MRATCVCTTAGGKCIRPWEWYKKTCTVFISSAKKSESGILNGARSVYQHDDRYPAACAVTMTDGGKYLITYVFSLEELYDLPLRG